MNPLVALGILWCVTVSGAASAANPQNGKKLFNDHSCNTCHAIGTEGTATTGPNLAGVAQLREHAWIKKWIMSPDQMVTDPIALKMIKQYASQMPNLGITDAQAEDLIDYLATIKKIKK